MLCGQPEALSLNGIDGPTRIWSVLMGTPTFTDANRMLLIRTTPKRSTKVLPVSAVASVPPSMEQGAVAAEDEKKARQRSATWLWRLNTRLVRGLVPGKKHSGN